MMNQLAALLGVMRYEYRMQIRRKALWITLLCFLLLRAALVLGSPDDIMFQAVTHLGRYRLLNIIIGWTTAVNYAFPIAVGCLLADRLPRDRRTKVNELFTATPGALSMRLFGKYLGSVLAVLAPMVIVYAAGLGWIVYQTQNMMASPLGLASFSAIILPGMLFIGAFSIACPAIIWVPLYQFLFVGYWFWGNLFPPGRGIPTLSNTLLSPAGGYVSAGFFGLSIFQVDSATVVQRCYYTFSYFDTGYVLICGLACSNARRSYLEQVASHASTMVADECSFDRACPGGRIADYSD